MTTIDLDFDLDVHTARTEWALRIATASDYVKVLAVPAAGVGMRELTRTRWGKE